MGFRTGAYAKVWEVTPMNETSTKIRISTSRKNKKTGEFEQDFSGYVLCLGSAAATNAMKLEEGSRIKLGDCDVTTRYDKERRITYTNYRLFSFEDADGGKTSTHDSTDPQPSVDSGEIDDSRLPY